MRSTLRLEPRMQVPIAITLAAPLVAIVLTLLLCAALIAWAGAPAGRAYILLFDGAFGSRFAIGGSSRVRSYSAETRWIAAAAAPATLRPA